MTFPFKILGPSATFFFILFGAVSLLLIRSSQVSTETVRIGTSVCYLSSTAITVFNCSCKSSASVESHIMKIVRCLSKPFLSSLEHCNVLLVEGCKSRKPS